MRFSATALLALAAPLLAYAQTNSTSSNGPNAFTIPQGGYTGKAGEVTNINWTPTTGGTVTIVLRSGASSNLIAGTVVASSVPNSGSYAWTVPSDITRGSDYALEIVDDADTSVTNFTPQFVIDSPNTVASVTNPVTLGTATGSASATGSSTSGSASSAASSGSMTGSAASASMTGSMTGSASGSSSMATSASGSSSRAASASASASDAVLTTTSQAGGARATAMAGMLGVVALGALAL